MPSALSAHGLCLRSRTSGDAVLDGVDFTVGPDEVLVIQGRSGSGRTVLLDICSGLVEPGQGFVCWDNRQVQTLSPRELTEARHALGCVFQAPALLTNMTVYDNIALPLRAWGVADEVCAIHVQDSLTQHGLGRVARAFPEDLPLAALRHAALARALVTEPGLLLLDEFTSGVDGDSEQELLDALGAYRSRRRAAIVIASNSERVLRTTGGRVATLAHGKLHFGVPSGYH